MKAIIQSVIGNIRHHIKHAEMQNVLQKTSWLLNLNGEETIGHLFFENDNHLLLSTPGYVKHGSWQILKTNTSLLVNIGNFNFVMNFITRNDFSIIFQKDSTDDFLILADAKIFDTFLLHKILNSYRDIVNSNTSLTQNLHIPSSNLFYVLSHSKTEGPYTIHQIRKLIANDQLNKNCFVRNENELDFSSQRRVIHLLD